MRKAFLIMGGAMVLCRSPRYVTEARSRGFDVLFIAPEIWRPLVTKCTGQPGHILNDLAEVGFVNGDMTVEGSFTAEVVAQMMAWRGRYDIQAVLPIGEVLVEPAGILADALGLPSAGLRASRTSRSKYLQRWYLPDVSPPALLLPPDDRRAAAGRWEGGYPAVVKPTGRFSSSGVRSVDSPAALARALQEYAPHEALLVERRIFGQEYSVESVVQQGRTVFSSVTRKETSEHYADTFVEMAHTQPGATGAAEETLRTLQQHLLRRLDWRDGIVHAEWRVDDQGQGWLMEVAARPPGDALLPLYELATGRSLVPALVDVALGVPATHPAPRRYARQVFVPQRPSVLRGVRLDWPGTACHWFTDADPWPTFTIGEPGDRPALRAVIVTRPVGTALAPPQQSSERAVSFLIDAPTPELLDEIEAEVGAALTLELDEPHGS